MFAFSKLSQENVVYYPDDQTEVWADVEISDKLTEIEVSSVKSVLLEYQDVFSCKPGLTNVTEHHIDKSESKPIRQHSYRIPQAYKEEFEREIQSMIEQNIIVRSSSDWAAPVVLVPKVQEGKK